ncbi:hypothetical protein [Gallaecimonas sp. GXIMD4217]|uniref:hypothetical protein n=1 Tax=Gallaecimonas sp. GXIMD4217 TaxID=3131927 RepID=UPI00311B32F5
MRGAGGTQGGLGQFFIGLVMLIAGGYLFLNAIVVTSHFGMGMGLFSLGGMKVTTGMVLVPFIFGIGLIFYDSRNWLGWLLAGAALVMLGFGIITSVNMSLRRMTAFELIMILVLLVGGLGLFLRSLKTLPSE